jgi:hypothetical protein
MPRPGGIGEPISCEIHSKRSAELGIPRSTTMDHMKLDLKVRHFHPLHVSEQSDADMNARKDASRAVLAAFHSQSSRGAMLFTDECAIYRSVHSRNLVFCAKESWRETHLTLWCELD